METQAPEYTAGLIDLGGMSLADLWNLDDEESQDTVLANSIRRVTQSVAELPTSICAFNSAM